MRNPPFPVRAYTEAHRATVRVDETSFYEGGQAINAPRAGKTGAVERAAFIEFVAAPCQSADDVQAKLNYLLTGSIGERDGLLDCLIDCGDVLNEKFLRSLILDAAPAKLAEAA